MQVTWPLFDLSLISLTPSIPIPSHLWHHGATSVSDVLFPVISNHYAGLARLAWWKDRWPDMGKRGNTRSSSSPPSNNMECSALEYTGLLSWKLPRLWILLRSWLCQDSWKGLQPKSAAIVWEEICDHESSSRLQSPLLGQGWFAVFGIFFKNMI